ncbi:MAG: hypothetical protein JO061_12485 [Acidobacteriaceae bacterium]|nr:hypothetical protein [Acidobacteriaceae bacterium]
MRVAVLLLMLSALTVCCSAAPDPNLLALTPSNVALVIGFDSAAVRSSQFGQYLLAQSEAQEAEIQKFIDQTGVDPRHDIDYALIAIHPDQKNATGVVLLRGSFNQQRMGAHIKAEGWTVETYDGIEILHEKRGSSGPEAALLQPGVLLIGDPVAVREVISGRSNPGMLDPKLSSMIDAVSSENDVWFAALPFGVGLAVGRDGVSGDSPASPLLKQAQVLQSIQRLSGGIRLADTVKVSLNAVARSPEDAGALGDVVRFAASTLEMQQQNNPQAAILAPAFEHMLLTTSGPDVHLVLSIPEKSLEQLAQAGPYVFDARPKTIQP